MNGDNCAKIGVSATSVSRRYDVGFTSVRAANGGGEIGCGCGGVKEGLGLVRRADDMRIAS